MLSSRSTYQAKLRDYERSKRTAFGEVGIIETIRFNKARGPSRNLHKIMLANTNTHTNMIITRLSVKW